MGLSNAGIPVTPGSGATVATHKPGGASETTQYQVNMIANSAGQIADSAPTYTLTVPSLPAAANRYHWELFNSPSSGKTLTVRGVWPVPDQSVGNAGNVVARFDLFRTTALSSGGTAAGTESSSTLVPNLCRMNPTDPSLSSHVTAKTMLTSITTGAAIFPVYASSCYTTTAAGMSLNIPGALVQGINFIPQREWGQELTIPAGQGMACRQGAIASAGNMGWLLQFTVDP